MNEHDEMTEKTLSALRGGVKTMELPPPPSVDRIIARGQARRHRRWSATALAAAVVAGAAITVPLLAHSSNDTTLKLGSKQVQVELAGYSINSDTNGTVTITVTNEQSLNPAYMQQVLAQAGVPAVIRVGSFCTTNTLPSGLSQVVQQGPQRNVLVITPSAMPEGAELSIGYLPDDAAFGLISAGQPMTCNPLVPPTN